MRSGTLGLETVVLRVSSDAHASLLRCMFYSANLFSLASVFLEPKLQRTHATVAVRAYRSSDT